MKPLLLPLFAAAVFFSCENQDRAEDPCTADVSAFSMTVKTSSGNRTFSFPSCTAERRWDYYFSGLSKYYIFYSYYPETMKPYYPFVKVTALSPASSSSGELNITLYADADSYAVYNLNLWNGLTKNPVTETITSIKLSWTGKASPGQSSGILTEAPIVSFSYP